MPKLISALTSIASIALDDVVIINDTSDVDDATRTKKASVQQLSDALITAAGAIPAVAGPVTNAGIAVFGDTTGETLADSGETVASILADAASAATAYADALTAADVGALADLSTVRTITASGDVLATDNGGMILCDVSAGAITLTFPAALSLGFRVRVVRYAASTTHALTLAGSGGGSHFFVPNSTLAAGYEVVDLVKITSSDPWAWITLPGFTPPSTTNVAAGAPVLFADASGRVLRAPVPVTTQNSTTLTLSSTHDQGHIRADMATIGNDLVVSIPDTLRPGFGCTIRKSGAGFAISFATGPGLITPTFRGQLTITADDTDVFVFVESATKAMVYVVEPAA